MSLVFLFSLFFVSFVVGGDYMASKCISLFLIFVFIVSYVKQIKFITLRVSKANNKLP